jgi:NADH-quinone oxidoreductase subunit I
MPLRRRDLDEFFGGRMRGQSLSIAGAIVKYFVGVYRGVSSVRRAIATSLPYLVSTKAGTHKKEVTEQYPDPVSSRAADELPARSRGILHNDINKCTGCGECQKVCPVKCILLQSEQGPSQGKLWVSIFDIDYSRCISCGLCVEVCEPTSLVHTRKYELSVTSTKDFVFSFGRGRLTQEQVSRWAEIRMAKENEDSSL